MDGFLKVLAYESRKEIQRFAAHRIKMGDLYMGDPEDLSCLCGIASFFLIQVAQKFGYNMLLVEGIAFDSRIKLLRRGKRMSLESNHCWIEFDNFVIDITATQFDNSLEEVHVVMKDSKKYKEKYWPCFYGEGVEENLYAEWPEEQSPFYYLTSLKRRANTLIKKLENQSKAA